MDSALQKLVEWLQSASPQLWSILLKQVYAQVIVDIIWTVVIFSVFIAVSLWFWPFVKAWKQEINEEAKKSRYDRYVRYDGFPLGGALAIYWVVSGMLVFIPALMNISSIVMRLYNPEYAAIQLILASFK